ncbi:iron ABC transporter substrate-binding protein, partial [Variovorax sp. RCC_210]
MTERSRVHGRAARALFGTSTAIAAWLAVTALPAQAAADELTLYTTREPALIQPLISAFSA